MGVEWSEAELTLHAAAKKSFLKQIEFASSLVNTPTKEKKHREWLVKAGFSDEEVQNIVNHERGYFGGSFFPSTRKVRSPHYGTRSYTWCAACRAIATYNWLLEYGSCAISIGQPWITFAPEIPSTQVSKVGLGDATLLCDLKTGKAKTVVARTNGTRYGLCFRDATDIGKIAMRVYQKLGAKKDSHRGIEPRGPMKRRDPARLQMLADLKEIRIQHLGGIESEYAKPEEEDTDFVTNDGILAGHHKQLRVHRVKTSAQWRTAYMDEEGEIEIAPPLKDDIVSTETPWLVKVERPVGLHPRAHLFPSQRERLAPDGFRLRERCKETLLHPSECGHCTPNVFSRDYAHLEWQKQSEGTTGWEE